VSETTVDTEAAVRTVLAAHAKLQSDAATVGVQADLYAAGLTSHASVNVMLALEDEFDIEFPDSMLRKATFVSIAAIAGAVQELTS
jgi:acyl carrier protein